ncbi:hypothetical protein BG011_007432 [Mortierella polycephala]|uniref:STB6-like N-terminal domain-containing protein n=1 Tax=Mortierella polycephala TaxID=41804 RepID=A0A9P6PS78_9FUNG|nr:hypothetical protein BG011_007432 [Mortierella polycephala]
MPLPTGNFVFCERGRITDICKGVDGIRIDTTEARLEGYQIYLVEQWAIERNREVATAVSFTGDPVHRIQVVAITILQQDVSCPRLEKVFEKLRKEGARPKEARMTPYGQLFVTNLSLFASSLNIVQVPQGIGASSAGDFDLHQRRFYLNLNLRRMGCSGRSALTSKPPSDAQREKFNQLYRISDSTNFEDTVIRLVNLVQNCLYIFGLFKLSDVDGLLCNATETGLDAFYNTFLSSKFQKFASPDNVLDPNVLAGMFSKMSNVRGKLQHLVNNVPKDPFAEPTAFINAVKAFQIKKPDLKACFLDLKTVEAINTAYQSSFNPQGLKVHKVLKSKIEDFSGMTVINPEGETTDLEVFAKHIHSESLKQVWRGKPKLKPDVADALASGDWLTGGKELGKSLVRGLAKTTRDTKYASQSLKSIAGGKNRQSLLLPKGKQIPTANVKEGFVAEDTPASSTPVERYQDNSLRSEDEKNEGSESEEMPISTTIALSATAPQGHEEDLPSVSAADPTQPSSNSTAVPSLDTLTMLFSKKPEPRGPPEIAAFHLDRKVNRQNSPTKKRSQSMTGLVGEERLLGCRNEASKGMGAIPGISTGPYRKIVKHPAHRGRTKSFSSFESKDASLRPLKSFVVQCDTQNYYSYQLLKEKEETLKHMFDRMQTVEKEFSSQLTALKDILGEREKQFEKIEHEANEILKQRRELLSEVQEKEHSTQRSVYHLDGMVGKLIEIRDFTGAFFNKISYLDTKLPVSQRRLALWMDKLQALQSQWFRTIARYMIAYAPSGIRGRFVEWERDVQLAVMRALELRGEVTDFQIGGGSTPLAPAMSMSTTASSDLGSRSLDGAGTEVFEKDRSTATATTYDFSMNGVGVVDTSSLGLLSRAGVRLARTNTPASSGPCIMTPQSPKAEEDDSSEKDVVQ